MESFLGVECIDRVRLVLNIFSQRASSKEARLQVERATLEYEIPFLREWIHNAKIGEHPGFLGAGEYETDAYYELIRRRLSRIKQELAKISGERERRRAQRRKRGLHLVTLAGYTNAGKSSLLNALTKERALVDGLMFSSLATTTSSLDKVDRQILVTDTVGFLSDLPHFLIESFKSTLEEVLASDLVLLVIDASDPLDNIRKKVATSADILFPEVDPTRLVIILNKVDKALAVKEKEEMINKMIRSRAVIQASALRGWGLDAVLENIKGFFTYPCEISFRAPPSSELDRLISWLHDHTQVERVEYSSAVTVQLRSRERDKATIEARVAGLEGEVTSALCHDNILEDNKRGETGSPKSTGNKGVPLLRRV